MFTTELAKSMYSWCDRNPPERTQLLNYWLSCNNIALASAVLNQPGTKVVVDVPDVKKFDTLAQKLLFFTDSIIIRDARPKQQKPRLEFVSLPHDHVPWSWPQLEGRKRPAMVRNFGGQVTILDAEPPVKLPDGTDAQPCGVDRPEYLQDGAYDWIFGSGRPYIESGQVVYAPFVPEREMELALLQHRVSCANFYGAYPLFHESVDFFDDTTIHAILSLELPTFANVPLQVLQQVRSDHHEEFVQFRTEILDAIQEAKLSVGSETFFNDIRRIQRDKVDDAVAQLRKRMDQIVKMRAMRTVGCAILTAFLGIGAVLDVPNTAMLAGVSANTAAFVSHLLKKLSEQKELSDMPAYFLFRLGQEAEQHAR